ncbi:MAG: hypothetical protein ACTSO9_09515 [Candidatus Helarchaeota archaeon]
MDNTTISLNYMKFFEKIPKEYKQIQEFFNNIKQEILTDVNSIENNLLNSMKIIIDDKPMVEKLEFFRQKIGQLRNDINNITVKLPISDGDKNKKIKDKKIKHQIKLFAIYYVVLYYVISRLNHKIQQLNNITLFDKERLMPNLQNLMENFQKTEEIIKSRNDLTIAELDINESIKKFKKFFPKLEKQFDEILVLPIFLSEEPKKMSKKEFKDYLQDLILEMKDDIIEEEGGLISLSNLYLKVKNLIDVDIDEIEKIIKKLSKKGLIAGIIKLDKGVKFVEFVSVTMTEDIEKIMNCVDEKKGWITLDEIIKKTNWPQNRILRSLDEMNKLRIVRKVSNYSGGERWYFPSIYNVNQE